MRDMQRIEIVRVLGNGSRREEDDVVVEEPLEIRVNNPSLVVTMRTPGDDFDLAAGLLRTEGFIRSIQQIGTMAYCENEEEPALKNVVNVNLNGNETRPIPARHGWMSSSCGLCGKATIDAIRQNVDPITSS